MGPFWTPPRPSVVPDSLKQRSRGGIAKKYSDFRPDGTVVEKSLRMWLAMVVSHAHSINSAIGFFQQFGFSLVQPLYYPQDPRSRSLDAIKFCERYSGHFRAVREKTRYPDRFTTPSSIEGTLIQQLPIFRISIFGE